MPRKASIVRRFEEERKKKEQELKHKQMRALRRQNKTTKTQKNKNKKRKRAGSESSWARVRKHVHSIGFMKLQFLRNGGDKSMEQMEETMTRLYEQLDVPNKSLSFYAENILLMTLHKAKSAALRFPGLKLLQLQKNAHRAIKGMSIREKHVNFLLAARFGHCERIRMYVDKELVDVNWTFNNGNNALHESILGNAFAVFDFLLDVPYIDFDYGNAHAVTPLFLAALKRNYFAVFKLVMRGADPDSDARGESVRDLAWGDAKLDIVLKEAERWRPEKNKPVRPSKVHPINALRTSSLVLAAAKKLRGSQEAHGYGYGYGGTHGDGQPAPRESEIGRAKMQVSNRYGEEHGKRQSRIKRVRKARGVFSGGDAQDEATDVSSDFDVDRFLQGATIKESAEQRKKAKNKKFKEQEVHSAAPNIKSRFRKSGISLSMEL